MIIKLLNLRSYLYNHMPAHIELTKDMLSEQAMDIVKELLGMEILKLSKAE